MQSRPFVNAATAISPIGLRVQSAIVGDDPALLIHAARAQGITYFHAMDAAAETLLTLDNASADAESKARLQRAACALQSSIATDCGASCERLAPSQLDVLWVAPESTEDVALEALLRDLRAMQAAGQIGTFGLSLAHLTVAAQINVGRWAIAQRVPLLSITYHIHTPQVGQALFPLVAAEPNDDPAQLATRFILPLPQETNMLDELLGADLAELVSTFARQTQQLRFLTENGRSLMQAAIQFALAQPAVACVLPTITTLGDLHNCIRACDTPSLSRAELNRLDDLVKHGFHLEPFDPPSVYNG